MSNRKEKDGGLEHAVHQIEGLILRQDPDLQDIEARIERNRWFDINGVSFEIDVLVTIGTGAAQYYHIIECKNWQRPVGTKEISHLDMKRRQLGARRTTLIARTVTDSARNLAVQSDIAIVPHSEAFVSLEINAPVFSTQAESGTISVNFYSPEGPKIHLSDRTVPCVFRNSLVLFDTIVSDAVQRAMAAAEASDPRRWLPGMHTGTAWFQETYCPGELILVGQSVAMMGSAFHYSARIVYPAIVTKFGVKDRGGLIRAEYPPGTIGRDNLALEVLTQPWPQGAGPRHVL